MLLAEALRDAGVRVMVHPGKSGFKSQRRRPTSGACFAVFAAEDELAAGTVSVSASRGREVLRRADGPAACWRRRGHCRRARRVIIQSS